MRFLEAISEREKRWYVRYGTEEDAMSMPGQKARNAFKVVNLSHFTPGLILFCLSESDDMHSILQNGPTYVTPLEIASGRLSDLGDIGVCSYAVQFR